MPDPQWYLDRLVGKLVADHPRMAKLDRYVEGDHDLPDADATVKQAYRRLLQQSRSNWPELIVDTRVERLHVKAFKEHTPGTVPGMPSSADVVAWDRWQANHLDAQQELVIFEALVHGRSYVLVDPTEEVVPGVPRITPEHPMQAICDYDPADPYEPTAGLKMWVDDESKRWFATLYLPDVVLKYASATTARAGYVPRTWNRRSDDAEVDNPLGRVPLREFRNRPRLGKDGRSEIEGVIDIVDRINATTFHRLLSENFAAHIQKWVTGLEIPVDPSTGRPVEPFRSAVDRVWVAENPDAKFGSFPATDLVPFVRAAEADIQHLAAISRTPPHYLLGQLVNLSAEALVAAETGLVNLIRRKQIGFGESWEAVMRLAAYAAGDEATHWSEVIWEDPEHRSEAALTDALGKQVALLGLPRIRAIGRLPSVSPQDVPEIVREMRQEALLAPPPQVTAVESVPAA